MVEHLRGLNPRKATGLCTRFLKEISAAVAPSLTLINQASLNQRLVPDGWRKANAAPIFMTGDRSKASNYHQVSHTPVCSKLAENIIHSHLMTHFEDNNTLKDYQHGLCKNRSREAKSKTQQLVWTNKHRSILFYPISLRRSTNWPTSDSFASCTITLIWRPSLNTALDSELYHCSDIWSPLRNRPSTAPVSGVLVYQRPIKQGQGQREAVRWWLPPIQKREFMLWMFYSESGETFM